MIIMRNFINDLIEKEQIKDNIEDIPIPKNKKVKYQDAQVLVGDKMPKQKKVKCKHCGKELSNTGFKNHERKCAEIQKSKESQIVPEPSKSTQDVKTPEPESQVPQESPEVKIEAVKSKPKLKPKPATRPVSRKANELFNKPEPKQEAKPATESNKTEKESKERGLFSFHRDD